jgi:hypothetical protein
MEMASEPKSLEWKAHISSSHVNYHRVRRCEQFAPRLRLGIGIRFEIFKGIDVGFQFLVHYLVKQSSRHPLMFVLRFQNVLLSRYDLPLHLNCFLVKVFTLIACPLIEDL